MEILPDRRPGDAKRSSGRSRSSASRPLAGAKAFTLSGGERRRLEIARAMISEPDFILLDEPFTGIDPIAIQELQRIIGGPEGRRGLGILITDHSVRETLRIVDRAYIIDKGRILKEGTPARDRRLGGRPAELSRRGFPIMKVGGSNDDHETAARPAAGPEADPRPGPQQAIKLLPLTNLELIEVIDEELSENPLLELEEEAAENGAAEPEAEAGGHGCRAGGPETARGRGGAGGLGAGEGGGRTARTPNSNPISRNISTTASAPFPRKPKRSPRSKTPCPRAPRSGTI